MLSDNQALSDFNALTLEGISVLDTLVTLLDRELEALQNRDLDAINAINQDKQHALLAFDKNNHDRNQLLESRDLPIDKQGIQALQKSATDSLLAKEFSNHWQQIEQTLERAMSANKRNEIVLARSKQNVEKLISLLRGQNPKNTLYDAKGGKGDYSSQSRIGKA